MSDTPTDQASETCSPANDCASGKAACSCRRWLPILLLAMAAVLYVRDIREARQRTKAANEIRRQISAPLTGIALGFRPEGRKIPMLVPLPLNIATNLLRQLAGTKPVKFPRGAVEGDEFELHLVQTNATTSVLFAAILEDDPSALYVRTRIVQARTDESDAKTTWGFSRPARVPEAGTTLAGVLRSIQDASGRLPPESEMLVAMSNATQRAEAPVEDAPKTSSPPEPARTAHPPPMGTDVAIPPPQPE